jgi:DNA repair exonuclease SbcCD nuclease subunit
MKIALINDTHFGVRGDSSVFLDNQERFFSEVFFPTIDQMGIDTIIDLGDTFDRRKYVNFLTLDRVTKFFFKPLIERGIAYHGIVGNHSCYFTNTNEVNSLTLLLKGYDNYHIYPHNPHEIKFGSTKVLLVPWVAKDNRDVCIEAIRNSSAHVLMGHLEIQGFEMQKGMLCEHGMSKDMFSHYESVFSGHFHHPSKIGNITYLGAQYEMTWSDHGGRRGFHVFDTETRELTFIENPNRMFFKINYDDVDMTADDVAELDVTALKGTYVKVIVQNRTNPFLFDMFMSKLADAGAADVKSVEDSLNLEAAGINDILDETKNTQEILHEYVDSIVTEIDKNRIKNVVNMLYSEALNVQ